MSPLFLLLLALLALFAGAAASLIPLRSVTWGRLSGPLPAVLAGGAAAISACWGLLGRHSWRCDFGPEILPFLKISLAMDPLSAFFTLVIAFVSALGAVYGRQYLSGQMEGRHPGLVWASFHMLFASMLMVVVADGAFFFLLSWELMALSSFFLVVFDNRRQEVREAGLTYLVATHLGTAFLIPMFLVLIPGGVSFVGGASNLTSTEANWCFVLALVGFGSKAGLIPFHVWLPEAHPAAPSHVSALMSGVMIKTGIYGLLRTLSVLASSSEPPMWWAWLLIGLGCLSAVGGVLFALAQHDLKRLLAYSSVENIGIIVIGAGLGLLGVASRQPVLAVLGLAGCLLHVANHALFKSLLFLGAGAVAEATHTRRMDLLGGLSKRMPATSLCFLTGAAAICGLPPLNGFVSEFLIYAGAFSVLADGAPPDVAVPAIMAVGALALVGGLAAACFTKAFGVVFLGEPRSAAAKKAGECGLFMRLPMLALSASCLLIGLFAPLAAAAVLPAARAVFPAGGRLADGLGGWDFCLFGVSVLGAALAVAAIALFLLRKALLAPRSVRRSCTWDCGYAAPSASMQYTASSFAQPLLDVFTGIVRQRRQLKEPAGLFPAEASLRTETPDLCNEAIFSPVFRGVSWLTGLSKPLQAGRVQSYILYIVMTLLILLLWNLR